MKQSKLFLGIHIIYFLAFAVMGAGCSSQVTRDNPFDPDGNNPRPGRIVGTVFIESAADPSGVQIRVYDSAGAEADAPVTDADGRFTTAEILPDIYRIEVDVPLENVPISRANIELDPGETLDIGLLASSAAPPDGRIVGAVTLENSNEAPQGIRMVASRRVGELTESWIQFTDAAGAYLFNEIPPGNYEVRADKEQFTPDFAELTVQSSVRNTAEAPAMRLYPASAVVRFSVPTPDGDVIGAPYTNSVDVDLLLLAFGGINQMRYSESPDFIEAGEEVSWRDHIAQVQVVLSNGEGKKALYAQFRLVADDDTERLRSDVYQTSVVLDQSPPSVLSYTVAPDAVDVGGKRYFSGDLSSVPVELQASDLFSGVAGVKLVLEGADSNTVPYADISSNASTISYGGLVSLSAGDGEKIVALQLIDGAGNETTLQNQTLVVDTTSPLELSIPGVSAVEAIGASLTDSSVTLNFDIGGDVASGIDGPVLMAYGVEPAPAEPSFVSFQNTVDLSLGLPHGSVVSFYAQFKDAAGNILSLSSPTYTMNLVGSLSGTAFLEGESEAVGDHSGTQVDVFNLSDNPSIATAIASSNTLNDGTFSLNDIPRGSYQVRYNRSGAISVLQSPIAVNAGQTTPLGITRLSLARGNLTGIFRFGDIAASGNHAGMTVSAVLNGIVKNTAITDESGAASLGDLPVANNYEVVATAAGYVSETKIGVGVVANATSQINDGVGACAPDCDPITLAELTGDFKICDRDDASSPISDCTAILSTNKNQALLGLDASDVTHVRYVLQDPLNTGVNSFGSPGAAPGGANDCVAPPDEDCWNPYSSATQYLASVDAEGEGRQTLVVQFADAIGVRPISVSQLVYDVSAPDSPTISIAMGADALVDGFTNDTEVSTELNASATDGVLGLSDVAPLATVRLSRDAIWDGDGSNGDREYSYGGNKTFDLAPVDGNQTLSAWFCDSAGNCTADIDAPTDNIVLDRIAPTRTNGIDIVPAGVGVSDRDLPNREWWARSTAYTVDINLGDSGTPGIPEALAYQVSLSQQFVGAPWNEVDLGAFGVNDTISDGGDDLTPVDAGYSVYSRYKDAAGNVSTELAENRFTLYYDSLAPNGIVQLAGGQQYTNVVTPATIVANLSTDGTATEIQSSWTSTLPDPYSDTRTTFTAAYLVEPPVSEGEHTLTVRFFDAAGNFSERSDTITVDLTAPSNTVSNCDSCVFNDVGAAFYSDALGELTLFLFANDTAGISSVEVLVDEGLAAEHTETLSYSPYSTITVSPVEGPHTLAVTFTDAAGNSTTTSAMTVTLDTTPPETTDVSINNGDGFIDTTEVSLQISGGDTGSGIARMALQNESIDCATASYEAFASTKFWSLSNADGPRTVHVCFEDAAGNQSTDSATIQLDRQAPSAGTVSIDGENANGYLQSGVGVGISISNTGADEMCVTGDVASAPSCDTEASWIPAAASATVNLSEGDGSKTVRVHFRDNSGNTIVASDTTVVDSQDPNGPSLSLSPTTFSGSTSVVANMGVSGASEMCLFGDFTGSPMDSCIDASIAWESLSSSKALVLTAGDGQKTVNVRFRDAAGRYADDVSDSVEFDGTAPFGESLTVNSGGAFTNSRTVNLILTATDTNLSAMAVQTTTSISCATATYEPFASTKSWVLPDSDVLHTISVCYQDAAGNTVSTTATITLDRSAPTLPSVSLNSGDAATSSTTVSLSLGAAGAAEMCIAGDVESPPTCDNNLDLGQSGWVALGASASATLSAGDGLKTVIVYFRDSAKNILLGADSIELDTTAASGEGIELSPSDYATTTSVSANLSVNDAVEMCLFGDFVGAPMDNCADGMSTGWEVFATSKALVLSPGDGNKTVNVKYRDAAQEAAGTSTGVATDSVFLDETDPPTVSLEINGGDTNTNSASVSLGLSADDGVSGSGIVEMALANGSITCSTASYESYVTSKSWDLASSNGLRTVAVCFRDNAGRTTSTTDTITLDTIAPSTASVSITDTSGYLTSPSSTALVLAATGATEMCVGGSLATPPLCSDSAPLGSEGWEAYATSDSIDFSSTDGTLQVVVKFRDAAGNVTTVSDTTILDTTSPTGASVSLSPSDYATSAAVTVALSASGASQYQLSGDFTGSPTTWAAITSSTTVNLLTATEGPKTVMVTYRDAAGNTSETASASVEYDSAAPTVTVSIDGGAATTTQKNVTLNLSVSDSGSGISAIAVRNDATCTSSTYTAYSGDTLSWNLSDTDGNKTVYVCIQDAAGRTASDSASIVMDRSSPFDVVLNLNSGGFFSNFGTVGATIGADDVTASILDYVITETPALDGSETWVSGVSKASFPVTWSAPAVDPLAGLADSSVEPYTFYAHVRDPAGNIETSSDTVWVDTSAPQWVGAVPVSFQEGSVAGPNTLGGASNDQATLAIQANGADEMQITDISLVGTCPSGASVWEDFSSVQSVTLTQNNATPNNFCVEIRDFAGNQPAPSFQLLSIINDTTDPVVFDFGGAPPSVTILAAIDDPPGYASSRSVELDLYTSSDDVVEVAIENIAGGGSIDCGAASYQPYIPFQFEPWTLATGDSTALDDKRVCACFRDLAGNYASECNTITLDTTAPTGLSMSIYADGTAPPSPALSTYSTGPVVDVLFSATDALSDDSFLFYMVTPFSTEEESLLFGFNYTQVPGGPTPFIHDNFGLDTFFEGTSQRVYLYVRDDAGNVSTTSTSIIFDATAPTFDETQITWTGVNNDYNDHDGDAANVDRVATGNTITIALNSTGAAEMCVTGPTQVSGIGSGARCEIDSDGAGPQITGPGWTTYASGAQTVSLDLTSEGLQFIEVYLRDAAGNYHIDNGFGLGDATILEVLRDVTPPAMDAITFLDDSFVPISSGLSKSPTLQIDSSFNTGYISGNGASVDAYQMSTSPTFSGAVWKEFSVDTGGTGFFTDLFTFSGTDGEKTLYVRVRDVAGNTSSVAACPASPTPPLVGQGCGRITIDTTHPVMYDIEANSIFSNLSTTLTMDVEDDISSHADLEICIFDPSGDITSLSPGIALASSGCGTAPDSDWYNYPNATNQFSVNWSPTEGQKTIAVHVRDRAGNIAGFPDVHALFDTSAPDVPALGFVKSLNEGALLTWGETDDNVGGAGISLYKVNFRTRDEGSSCSSSLSSVSIYSVSGDENHASVYSNDTESVFLNNKTQYCFCVVARDQAGNESACSAWDDVAVGWSVNSVISSNSAVLVPQGVAYEQGKIYVLYHEQGSLAQYPTVVASTIKLAISEDGGETWRISVVRELGSSNPSMSPGRVNSTLTLGQRGISVVTSGYGPTPDMKLLEYFSEDDGLSWTEVDILEPLGINKIGDAGVTEFTLATAGTGSSRTVLYTIDTDASGGGERLEVRMVRTADDVREYAGVPAEQQWWKQPLGGNNIHGDPGRRFSACNANLIDRATWTIPRPNTAQALDNGFEPRLNFGLAWSSVSPFHGQGPWEPQFPSVGGGILESDGSRIGTIAYGELLGDLASPMRHIFNTVTCAGLGSLEWSYMLSTSMVGGSPQILFKARSGKFPFSLSDPLVEDPAWQLWADDVDSSTYPAAWADDDKIYGAYRRGGDSALVVRVGQHDLVNCSPNCEVAFEWKNNVVDDSGDAGFNPVMTGYAEGSPIIAYTDIFGTEIKIARAAMLAPQTAPEVRDDLIRFKWSEVSEARNYEMITQCDEAEPTLIATTDTLATFDASAGNMCIGVAAVDDSDRISDTGEFWTVAAFQSTQDLPAESAGAYPPIPRSSESDVAAIGDVVVLLTPLMNQIRLNYSTDGGMSFEQNLVASGGSYRARSLALTRDADASVTYVHVVYQNETAIPSTMVYERYSYDETSSTWSFVAAPSVVYSGLNPRGQWAQVRAEGDQIVIVDVEGMMLGRRIHATIRDANTVSPTQTQRTLTGVVTGAFSDPTLADIEVDTSTSPDTVLKIYTFYKENGAIKYNDYDNGGGGSIVGDFIVCDSIECGNVALIAPTRSQRFFNVMSTGSASGGFGSSKRVRTTMTSQEIAGLGSTVGQFAWLTGNLSATEQVVLFNSLDSVANDQGTWGVYGTCSDLGLNALWKLNMAYCQSGCQSMENWNVSVVHSTSGAAGEGCQGEWYGALSLSLDDTGSEPRLYIGYYTDDWESATPAYNLLYGGYVGKANY